ncbi:hypothetical protein OV207_12085 [Corallococcus sp. BB11-1]|uniref:hypothetical protein n=1 Tax=Corallococcus sp. BB11-1 TaxID=2996783 RepID=UPI0010E415C2|nr:hypothetical protein [Corallococcus sp. BB11-1]MCY1032200.1 hypothetical protein [Corallococcus sp. BB11-1]RYZ46242.1 MAG: hypothetical protein EOO72_02465 [Myxococcaceae bacterium]
MMRIRLFSLLLLGLTWACSSQPPTPAAPVRSENSGLGTVVSVERVHITQGFTVWRDGEELTAHEGLLIRLDGVNGGNFIPRAITPPLFVLDRSVGMTLLTPTWGRQAVLLMPSPPPDTEAGLWMTLPGASEQHLKGAELESARDRALSANAHGGANVRTPPADAPTTPYPTQEALMDTLMTIKASPEICKGIGKECGYIPQTFLGRMDCGACPAAKVCNLQNQCCTPTTCEALGLTCGYAADGCGGSLDCGFCFRP